MKRSSSAKGKKLTHFDARGEAHMVDVADKAETRRIARARGSIRMQAATLRLIQEGTAKKATCSAWRVLPRSRRQSALRI